MKVYIVNYLETDETEVYKTFESAVAAAREEIESYLEVAARTIGEDFKNKEKVNMFKELEDSIAEYGNKGFFVEEIVACAEYEVKE